jgi:repressor of nif and glnA expression
MTAWKDRTEAGRRVHILVDPETRDWRIGDDGHLAWDSTVCSAVYDAVMTRRGSVPVNPGYGSGIHEAWKMSDRMPRELSTDIVSSLEPLVKSGAIREGTISVTVEASGGYLVQVRIEFEDGGGDKQRLDIPIQPGYLT